MTTSNMKYKFKTFQHKLGEFLLIHSTAAITTNATTSVFATQQTLTLKFCRGVFTSANSVAL